MEISEIRMQAKGLLKNHQQTMIYICMIVGLIKFLPNFLPDSSIGNTISLLMILALVTIEHGYVTSSLKLVRGQENRLDEKKDGCVGFIRFTALFTTYLLKEILSFLPLIVVGVAGIFSFALKMHSLPTLLASPTSYLASIDINKVNPLYFLLLFIALCLCIWLTIRFSMTGYFLEDKGYKNMKACMMSFKMVNYPRLKSQACLV